MTSTLHKFPHKMQTVLGCHSSNETCRLRFNAVDESALPSNLADTYRRRCRQLNIGSWHRSITRPWQRNRRNGAQNSNTSSANLRYFVRGSHTHSHTITHSHPTAQPASHPICQPSESCTPASRNPPPAPTSHLCHQHTTTTASSSSNDVENRKAFVYALRTTRICTCLTCTLLGLLDA